MVHSTKWHFPAVFYVNAWSLEISLSFHLFFKMLGYISSRFHEICDWLESFIDPFDLDVFTPLLNANLSRLSQRTSVRCSHMTTHEGKMKIAADVVYRNIMSEDAADELLITVPFRCCWVCLLGQRSSLLHGAVLWTPRNLTTSCHWPAARSGQWSPSVQGIFQLFKVAFYVKVSNMPLVCSVHLWQDWWSNEHILWSFTSTKQQQLCSAVWWKNNTVWNWQQFKFKTSISRTCYKNLIIYFWTTFFYD